MGGESHASLYPSAKMLPSTMGIKECGHIGWCRLCNTCPYLVSHCPSNDCARHLKYKMVVSNNPVR